MMVGCKTSGDENQTFYEGDYLLGVRENECYITQAGKEARKAGIKSLRGIARGTIPTYGKPFFDLVRRQS